MKRLEKGNFEAEKELHDEDKLIDEHSETVETIQVKSFNRKKAGKKPLPANLPRKDIFHDLPESEKICSCGQCLTKIGEEISEKLGFIPAELFVERHIDRPILKYSLPYSLNASLRISHSRFLGSLEYISKL